MNTRKNGLPDRRFATNKAEMIKRKALARRLFIQQLVASAILGFIAGSILISTLWREANRPLITPLVEPMTFEVGKVEAVEPLPTPTIKKPTRNYTYHKHFRNKHYAEIIAYLKEIYVNWEDGAELVARESSFDPHVINPSSGSCYLPQALPCSKMGCEGGDIKCQLDWQKKYVAGRYGTITKDLDHSLVKNWY
jgi:hypothetical protein